MPKNAFYHIYSMPDEVYIMQNPGVLYNLIVPGMHYPITPNLSPYY
ncbi:hypothetical protein JW964_16835 [candidate division KSB1 bacterium]|nr:hypothetical protein [candidate division KSB1 bacterium]